MESCTGSNSRSSKFSVEENNESQSSLSILTFLDKAGSSKSSAWKEGPTINSGHVSERITHLSFKSPSSRAVLKT